MSDLEINLPRSLVEKANRDKKLKELLVSYTHQHLFWTLYDRWLDGLEVKLKEFLSQPSETIPDWASTVNLSATPPAPGKAGGIRWTQGPPIV